MKVLHVFLFSFTACTLLFSPCAIPAEPGCAPYMIMIGGTPAPKSPHDSIRLDSEEVTIRLKEASYTVESIVHFFNTGKTTTEWIGFPKRVMKSWSNVCPEPSYLVNDFVSFDAWVDNRKAEWSEEKDFLAPEGMLLWGEPSDSATVESRWMVTQVTFPGHAQTTIRVKYRGRYATYDEAFYMYGTGGFWKGKIGKATFFIDGTDVGGTKNMRAHLQAVPGPALISDNVVMFEVGDFKPSSRADLKVTFRPE